jgi:hypothetical protein
MVEMRCVNIRWLAMSIASVVFANACGGSGGTGISPSAPSTLQIHD